MGAKQTKIEGSYLPSTPVVQATTAQFINMDFNGENNTLDPRSPAGCRTPICNKRLGSNAQLAEVDVPEREINNTDNALDVLRKRFFRGFTYNLNDPRSPTLNLNRTPLVFEDALEKSLSLDDTFADLLVEPRLPETHKPDSSCELEIKSGKCELEEVDIEMPEEKVILDLEETKNTPHRPVALLQQEFDPRSPSIGVERTPILFTDDEVDDSNEDVMLENILATLSLNLNSSGNSSVVSMATQNANVKFNDNNVLHVVNKPTNKHLDRVRAGKKNSPKAATHRKPKRRLSRQQIYEDRENHLPSTPKLKISQIDKNDSIKSKRTPLSCVRNRNATHARSRSVESSAKSLKARLALTSFDDSLNPADNKKVPNLRIMQQGSQDSLEL
ncbi:msb1l isoform 2-T2 [Cochliomyia hominivorax]